MNPQPQQPRALITVVALAAVAGVTGAFLPGAAGFVIPAFALPIAALATAVWIEPALGRRPQPRQPR